MEYKWADTARVRAKTLPTKIEGLKKLKIGDKIPVFITKFRDKNKVCLAHVNCTANAF